MAFWFVFHPTTVYPDLAVRVGLVIEHDSFVLYRSQLLLDALDVAASLS